MSNTEHRCAVSQAYDVVDRFLRNNLDDNGYAVYSEYLDLVAGDEEVSVNLKPIVWSEERKPNGVSSFYDHVVAPTAMGELKIEWKSWKAYDSYCIYLNEEYIVTVSDSLEVAKARAVKHVRDMVMGMIV